MSRKPKLCEERSDLQLIRQFKLGDQRSFEELIQRYSTKVYSLVSRLTRNAEDAEEVFQDIFVTVYRKIGGFEGKSSFSSWLYRVSVNAAFMKLRKRKQNRSIPIEEAFQDFKDNLLLRDSETREADNAAQRNQLCQALELAIRKLPEDYRPVFILRDIDGLTSKEVGKILNLTIPAVKSRLHRSRLMLRRKLLGFYRQYREADKAARAAAVGE